MADTDQAAQHLADTIDADIADKAITNSRWQKESSTPRYGRDEQKTLDSILACTSGFFRGARINK